MKKLIQKDFKKICLLTLKHKTTHIEFYRGNLICTPYFEPYTEPLNEYQL